MARDGYLPRIFAGSEGKPPVFSIVLQGAVATCVIYVQSLEKMIKNVSTLLLIFSSLTVAGVYRLYFSAAMREKYGVVPSLVSLGAAALFMVFSGWMVYAQLDDQLSLLWWIGAVVGGALVAYVATTMLSPNVDKDRRW